MIAETTARIYDDAAAKWDRTQPTLLSDYTARPFVLQRLAPLKGARVLDIGCGEGYVSRRIQEEGAAQVVGIDISEGMIARARAREASASQGIEYHVGSATDLSMFETASFDVVCAVFLFNYLTRAETTAVLASARRVLRPGGRMLFTVPHPALPFLRGREAPFYFERGDAGYFSGRDSLFEGRIFRRDGTSVPVRNVHKTFSDYFGCLSEAGFTSLPEITELGVNAEHLALDPAFFGPLAEQPLHVAFHIT